MLSRNDLAIRVLVPHIARAKVGVVASNLRGIELGRIVPELARELAARQLPAADLHVAFVGSNAPGDTGALTVSTRIEDAVEWRNTPALAGRILVFVQGEVDKQHSLAALDSITPRDLTRHLLVWARDALARNEPQRRLWAALEEFAAALPLGMVEDFVAAVARQPDEVDALPRNLWRLGLLRDDRLLSAAGPTPLQQLERNRSLMLEMIQLSEPSRRRIAGALRAAGSEPALREGYEALRTYRRYGTPRELERLSVDMVGRLVTAARPTPSAIVAPVPATGSADQPSSEQSSDPLGSSANDPTESPSTLGKLDLQQTRNAIGACALDDSPEAQETLAHLAAALGDALADEEAHFDRLSVPGVFGGATLNIPEPDAAVRRFVGVACADGAWGGVVESPLASLREVAERFTPDQLRPYRPDDPAAELNGLSPFAVLRALDADLTPGAAGRTFGAALDRLTAARAVLAPHIPLLLTEPAVLLRGVPEARAAVDAYIVAYADLLRLFHEHEPDLHARNQAQATAVAAAELLRLDVLHVRTPGHAPGSPGAWRAVLTPLHPLHLWRYRQILEFAERSRDLLSDATNAAQLADALTQPERAVLPFLPLSPSVIGHQPLALPQAGWLGPLPTYEGDTNRYLGADGTDFVLEALRRWIVDAAYTAVQVRLALVDAPDLRAALGAVAQFLQTQPRANVVCDVYVTHGRGSEDDLGRLTYEGKDYGVAALLQSGRLAVEIRRAADAAEVAERMTERPVHVAVLFDQSQYRIMHEPRSRYLTVSPLVVTHEYTYDRTFERGEIMPSAQADEGLFDDLEFLITRATASAAGQRQRLRQASGADLAPVNTLLARGAARWLVLADRTLMPYRPTEAVPVAEVLRGQREVGVWAREQSQSVQQYVRLLRQYNLNPRVETVAALLRQFGHVASGGLLGMPAPSGGSAALHLTRRKGLLGAVLGAAWYVDRYPGALVASLDSPLARQWLQERRGPQDLRQEQRADLIGVRRVDEHSVVIEPIEVKTTEATDVVVQEALPAPRAGVRLRGRAVEQLRSTLGLLRPIFAGSTDDALFTAARREVLKYQLYRECFRHVHSATWQRDWFERLNTIFAPGGPSARVGVEALVLHIDLGDGARQVVEATDAEDPVRYARASGRVIQKLIETPPAANSPAGKIVSEWAAEAAEDRPAVGSGPRHTGATIAASQHPPGDRALDVASAAPAFGRDGIGAAESAPTPPEGPDARTSVRPPTGSDVRKTGGLALPVSPARTTPSEPLGTTAGGADTAADGEGPVRDPRPSQPHGDTLAVANDTAGSSRAAQAPAVGVTLSATSRDRANAAVGDRSSATPPASAARHEPASISDDRSEANEMAQLFLRACKAFRIQVIACDPARAARGPMVWRFYVRLAPHQRVDALRGHLEDIGREMRRSGLIISSLPNSNEVALDVPAAERRPAPLRDALAALPVIRSVEQLPVALGITPEGERLTPDLSRVHHLLVAGTTGAGKTMFLYSLLASLLSTHAAPGSLQLIVSTSKPEDFVFFADVPQITAGGVIADADCALDVLRTTVQREFDAREARLMSTKSRDIGEYNRRHPDAPMTPLVVIVDELADLADQLDGDRAARNAFYLNLRRIAQMGRNRGVHLVLCTQRPSADLLPTNIRTLMNARVALRLNDGVASRMILDEGGAEMLQMHGDMLFKDQSTITRAQGYHIDSEDLDALLTRLVPRPEPAAGTASAGNGPLVGDHGDQDGNVG